MQILPTAGHRIVIGHSREIIRRGKKRNPNRRSVEIGLNSRVERYWETDLKIN